MGIFSSENMHKLLHNKFVLLIGDSVQRSIYKDLVVLYNENRFISDKELRAKGETSFLNDTLVDRSELTNGVHYKEVREFKSDHILIRFYFATRIYNDYIESVLKQYENDNEHVPDVVLLNSCLWDISRYGKKGWNQYQKNIEKFCSRLDDIVPAKTCIIWRTTLPVSQDARGGFLSSDTVRNKDSLVVDVLLANYLAHAVVVRHKYDVIDMHFMFTQQQQRRAKDGIHWNMYAHRRMTNIILSHVSEAWGLGMPSHPSSLQEDDFNFDADDISMNTTDVLKSAYPKTMAVGNKRPMMNCSPRMMAAHNQRANEERYGGPIRNNEEMFNYYNKFYGMESQTTEIFSESQENAAPFVFDVHLTPPMHANRHFQADYDDYWALDDPLSTYKRSPASYAGFKEYYGNSRKVELAPMNKIPFNLNLPVNPHPHWKSNHPGMPSLRGKAPKKKMRHAAFQPYKNRPRGTR